jgi:hypothetical protein
MEAKVGKKPTMMNHNYLEKNKYAKRNKSERMGKLANA